MPFYPGDTYEEWYEIFQIGKIKESWDGEYYEEYTIYSPSTDSIQVLSEDGWQVCVFWDLYNAEWKDVRLRNEDMTLSIIPIFEDGIAVWVRYYGYSKIDNE